MSESNLAGVSRSYRSHGGEDRLPKHVDGLEVAEVVDPVVDEVPEPEVVDPVVDEVPEPETVELDPEAPVADAEGNLEEPVVEAPEVDLPLDGV